MRRGFDGQAYQKRGYPWLWSWRFGYVVTDAAKWGVNHERYASEFDAG